MLQLFIIRHGETTSNLAGRWQGHGDSPLSPTGLAQAQTLGARFADLPFDAVYSSDLQRARHTADQLLGPRIIDPIFREISVGRWEGHTKAEVQAQWPEDFAELDQRVDDALGGGESWSQVATRTAQGLSTLRARHPTGRMALVVHGGVILTMMEHLLGLPWRPRPRVFGRVRNTAIAELHLQGDQAKLVRYNDVSHVRSPEPIPNHLSIPFVVERTTHGPTAAGAVALDPTRLAALEPGLAGQVLRSALGNILLSWNISVETP
jgi:broad specificity phosphatase PhoE